MVIDQETYKLPETNYYSTEFKKRQIVLGNSFSESHKHIKCWYTSPFLSIVNIDVFLYVPPSLFNQPFMCL